MQPWLILTLGALFVLPFAYLLVMWLLNMQKKKLLKRYEQEKDDDRTKSGEEFKEAREFRESFSRDRGIEESDIEHVSEGQTPLELPREDDNSNGRHSKLASFFKRISRRRST